MTEAERKRRPTMGEVLHATWPTHTFGHYSTAVVEAVVIRVARTFVEVMIGGLVCRFRPWKKGESLYGTPNHSVPTGAVLRRLSPEELEEVAKEKEHYDLKMHLESRSWSAWGQLSLEQLRYIRDLLDNPSGPKELP
jgi:hypothetical protein